MAKNLPTVDDILDASSRLKGQAVRTPLLTNDRLNSLSGANVFIKPECLQRTGSFKFRGAFNAVSRLSKEELNKGVVASSSGNHAQGIAAACKLLGARATIIMPNDAPSLKVERTKAHGAEVVFYDRVSQDREDFAKSVFLERGGTFVHPFEHPDVIAGQGTVGLEIAEDLEVKGQSLDRVLICTGGGGLTAGVTIAIKSKFPSAKIHTVEPELFDDYNRSLQAGERIANEATTGSICDAIMSPAPGVLSFDICKGQIESGLVVTDNDALEAMKFAHEELKLVTEPGGAVALAAMLQAGTRWQGETIAVIISGGNVDPDQFCKAID